MITMVLGGLWHGADWTFVFWGALQGAGQSFGHLRRIQPRPTGTAGAWRTGPVRVWVQRFLTFQFVCLGWVFFNATGMSQAFAVLGRMFKRVGCRPPRSSPRCWSSPSWAPSPPSTCRRSAWAACRRRSPASSAAVQVGLLGVRPARHHHLRSGRRRALHLLPLLMTDARTPPHPRRLGVALGVAVAPPRRAGAADPTAGCGPIGRACWRSAPPPSRVWFLLFAPTLQHNAQVSPVGTRRTSQPRRGRPGGRAQPRAPALTHRLAHGPFEPAANGTVGLITSGPRPRPASTAQVHDGAEGGHGAQPPRRGCRPTRRSRPRLRRSAC